jgi:hypothetical protein
MASSALERRILNQTFFKRLLIGEESEVLGATLTPVYAAVAEWNPDLGQPATEALRNPPGGLQVQTPTPFLGARVWTSQD